MRVHLSTDDIILIQQCISVSIFNINSILDNNEYKDKDYIQSLKIKKKKLFKILKNL